MNPESNPVGAREPEAVLRARAQALARVSAAAEVGEQLEVLQFRLAWEDYAVEARHVREVGALEQITPLPGTPAFVLGVVHLHGEIVSVIDLRTFFELPDQGLSDLNRLIVLEGAGMRFGILADAITGMSRLPLAQLQPPPPTLTGMRAKYLRGLTPARTVLLDAGLLLTDETLVVRDPPVTSGHRTNDLRG